MLDRVKNLEKNYLKSWFLTTRPKTLLLSIFPFLVGTVFALHETATIRWSLMFFGMLSALFIQIGTNFINDVFDFKNRADTPLRMGPKRGIQNGDLTPTEVFLAALTSFALALLFGVPLVLKGGVLICFVLLASIFSGYIYTGGKMPLAYYGLGEVFVLFFFGIVSTTSAFFFQTGRISFDILLVGFQLGLLASLPIAINNLRDIDTDKTVSKNTLAVRFGKKFARGEIALLAFLPYLVNPFFTISCLTLPLAFSLVKDVWKTEPSSLYNFFLVKSLLLYLLFGLSLIISVMA